MRIGIDIGGTFTDVTAFDDDSADLTHLKLLTTSSGPVEAVLQALAAAGIDLPRVRQMSHGTTLAINAVIERMGAHTALIATKGFEHVLELRRGARTHLADPLMDKPIPFVALRDAIGVSGRVAASGEILQPIHNEEILDAVDRLVADGVESIAICLLNAYANSELETGLARLIADRWPLLHLTKSTDIVGEIGEFERASTAVVNAYIHPKVQHHLETMQVELRSKGMDCGVYIMRSNGGIMTADQAAQSPIYMLESGPAAGAIAAAYFGSSLGADRLIAFDMGGTTAKAAVIEEGQPLMTVDYELGEQAGAPGSGWPIRVPMIDIVETGAGGGSIAQVDGQRRLNVGPRSAGADPGPVCYGRGGHEPTLTDANAVLGRLRSLVGGTIALDIAAAGDAVKAQISAKLDIDVEEAAAGIVEIADAKAADALRVVTVARGRDPREFSLMAYGGAGPMEAAYMVRELGLARAIIPPQPGNFSAFGLLCSDIIHDAVRTYICSINDLDAKQLRMLCDAVEAEVRGRLAAHGVAPDDLSVSHSVDLRYKGQFHLVPVPLSWDLESHDAIERLQMAFHAEHERLFAFTAAKDPIELVNVRSRAVGVVSRPKFEEHLQPKSHTRNGGPRSVRQVYFREIGKSVTTPVFDRSDLPLGFEVDGPAIVEELTSTTLLPPGFRLEMGDLGALLITGAR